MNKADRKAEAARRVDAMWHGIEQIAAVRRELRDKYPGLPLPPDVLAMLMNMRRTLHQAGIPLSMLDRTPGLELPDRWGQ